MSFVKSLFIFLIFLSNLVHPISAQEDLQVYLKSSIEEGLNYLENNQIKETTDGVRYAGEWPNYMTLQRGFMYLGKKRSLEDSNCFTVASIHNALAVIYLNHPEYEMILPMLDKAFSKMVTYRHGPGFNFWNLLPPQRNLKARNEPDPQPLVRRPTNFDLRSRYINNAANVVEDADDTALAFMAMAYRRKILEIGTLEDKWHFSTDSLGMFLDQYRDQDRKNRHWYNVISGNDHDTGAYLTWLGEEYRFKRWNVLFDFIHAMFFYLPISEHYPHPYKPYIPYGSNNMDAVVNSNILAALAANDIDNAKGIKDATKYVEKKSAKKKYRRVGSYYPNSYHFPYALSEAYANGANDLDVSANNIVKNILANQCKDGSWESRRKLNKRDRIQSTAYALNALINFGNYSSRNTKKAIEAGIEYLASKTIKDASGVHWEGGVFFAGGTVVRNNLIWKSDAFTTVIILKAYSNYLTYLESS